MVLAEDLETFIITPVLERNACCCLLLLSLLINNLTKFIYKKRMKTIVSSTSVLQLLSESEDYQDRRQSHRFFTAANMKLLIVNQ